MRELYLKGSDVHIDHSNYTGIVDRERKFSIWELPSSTQSK